MHSAEAQNSTRLPETLTLTLALALPSPSPNPNPNPNWFRRYQYVSTSGVNAGVGIAGLLLIVLSTLSAPTARIGPQPDGPCTDVSLPARTAEDVACWNAINGYSGCNTPWPSN